jgi:hypothetical protein
MKSKQHDVVITARNKDVLQSLLNLEEMPFIDTGKGKLGSGAIGKLLYLLYAELFFYFLFIKHKPNIVLSFGSTPCAHNCFIFRIPHISFDDTEHAKLNRKLYAPFTEVIFTPSCFYEEVGKNQFRFNSYMELFYLHPSKFLPSKNYNEILKKEKAVLLRFVSWEAFHDIGQKGLTIDEKIKLTKLISKDYDVFISSESELPQELKKFNLNIPVNEIHNFLTNIDLYIGEGGTMASECAMLGIPSIYINSLPLMGYLKEAKEYGLLFHMTSYNEIVEKSLEILRDKESKKIYISRKNDFIAGKIDPNSMLVWFIENYPESKVELFHNPSCQDKFIR